MHARRHAPLHGSTRVKPDLSAPPVRGRCEAGRAAAPATQRHALERTVHRHRRDRAHHILCRHCDAMLCLASPPPRDRGRSHWTRSFLRAAWGCLARATSATVPCSLSSAAHPSLLAEPEAHRPEGVRGAVGQRGCPALRGGRATPGAARRPRPAHPLLAEPEAHTPGWRAQAAHTAGRPPSSLWPSPRLIDPRRRWRWALQLRSCLVFPAARPAPPAQPAQQHTTIRLPQNSIPARTRTPSPRLARSARLAAPVHLPCCLPGELLVRAPKKFSKGVRGSPRTESGCGVRH